MGVVMMGKRLVFPSIAALLLAGCESGAVTTAATPTIQLPFSSEVQFQSDELACQVQALAVQETAVAQAPREAQDIAMRATTDALAAQAQVTRQVMDAADTQQAIDLEATRRAAALNATATMRLPSATREALAARQEEMLSSVTWEATRGVIKTVMLVALSGVIIWLVVMWQQRRQMLLLSAESEMVIKNDTEDVADLE